MKLKIKEQEEDKEITKLYLENRSNGEVSLMADTPTSDGLIIAYIFPNGEMEIWDGNGVVTKVKNQEGKKLTIKE